MRGLGWSWPSIQSKRQRFQPGPHPGGKRGQLPVGMATSQSHRTLTNRSESQKEFRTFVLILRKDIIFACEERFFSFYASTIFLRSPLEVLY